MTTPTVTFNDEVYPPMAQQQKAVTFDFASIGTPTASISGSYSSYMSVTIQPADSTWFSLGVTFNASMGYELANNVSNGTTLATITVSLTFDGVTKTLSFPVTWQGDDYAFVKFIMDDQTQYGEGNIDNVSVCDGYYDQGQWTWNENNYVSVNLNTIYSLGAFPSFSQKLKVLFNSISQHHGTFNYRIKVGSSVKDQMVDTLGSKSLYWSPLPGNAYDVTLEISDGTSTGPPGPP